MTNYKEIFYKKYFSTHILPRKGEPTLQEFLERCIAYQQHFGKFLPQDKNARIIDIGCGNGSIVWWLQKVGFANSGGIDISAEQVAIAKKLGVANIKQADIREFLKDKKDIYDVIFARDIIEHFNKEDIVEILSSCYTSLKNNGIMIIQTPNAESPFGSRIRYIDFTHEVAFTTISLSQLFNVVGFRESNFFPSPPIVYTNKSFIRFILWKIVEAFYKFFLLIELGPGKRIVTQNFIAVAKK